MPDPTTPEPRWTPETERVVAQAMLAELDRQEANDDDELSVGWYVAHASLTALADAGLLVTPQMTAFIEALREVHRPELRTVEWWDDQNGKGEALCCSSCTNANPTEWHPAIGEAGEKPSDDFVTPYVVWPCPTLAAIDALEGTDV